MKITIRHGVAFAGESGRSRAGVFPLPTGAVVAIADGQDDPARAGQAAEIVLKFAEELAEKQELRTNYQVFNEHLVKLDQTTAGDDVASECSVIVAAISEKGIAGYSVGNSRAWFFNPHSATELTARQQAGPLVGSGKVALMPFAIQSAVGTILFCTDGLWQHAEQDQMLQIAGGEDLGQATKELLALPRYPSGGLPDDVAVILCRLEND